jgi:hypothetical protein
MSSKVFYRTATIAVTALAMSGLQSPLRAEYFKSFNRDKRGANGNDASQVAFFCGTREACFFFSGGHGARTRNRFPGTTFPVWPLTIRLPSGSHQGLNRARECSRRCDDLSNLTSRREWRKSGGLGKHVLWRSGLNDPSLRQNDDLVRQTGGLLAVVGHQHDGDGEVSQPISQLYA